MIKQKEILENISIIAKNANQIKDLENYLTNESIIK
jgi:hypothetical protein